MHEEIEDTIGYQGYNIARIHEATPNLTGLAGSLAGSVVHVKMND